jgi:hypothetical protein
MINIEVIAHIYRPLTQVFAFIAMPDNDFQWQYGTLASSIVSEGRVQVGAKFRSIAHFMGRRIETLNEITEYEPNKAYAYKSLTGPVDTKTRFTFQITQNSTEIHISTHIDQKDLFKTTDAMVEKKFKRQYKENLEILKNLLESRQIVMAQI